MKKELLFFCGIIVMVSLLFIISCSQASQNDQTPFFSEDQEGSGTGTEPKYSTTGQSDQDILKEYPDALDSALTDLDMVEE